MSSTEKAQDIKENTESETTTDKKNLRVPKKGARGMRKQPTTCNGCQETFQNSFG